MQLDVGSEPPFRLAYMKDIHIVHEIFSTTFGPVQTDRQQTTDNRQKVMHMSPPVHLAQKNWETLLQEKIKFQKAFLRENNFIFDFHLSPPIIRLRQLEFPFLIR